VKQVKGQGTQAVIMVLDNDSERLMITVARGTQHLRSDLTALAGARRDACFGGRRLNGYHCGTPLRGPRDRRHRCDCPEKLHNLLDTATARILSAFAQLIAHTGAPTAPRPATCAWCTAAWFQPVLTQQ
jgi:hypothetical protein